MMRSGLWVRLASAALLASAPVVALAQDGAPPLERARALLGSGKVDEAIAVLRAGAAGNPDDAPIHNALGAILNREGRYAEALVHAQRAAVLAPTNSRYRYNRGIVLAEHGRFAEALADFDFAIAATPDDAAMYLERGAALLSLDKADRARADWASARKLDPSLVWVDWYEGFHDLVDERYDVAIAALDRVAQAQPDFASAQNWLTVAHLLAGSSHRPAEVAEPWVKAILAFHAGEIGAERLLEIARADQTTGDARREGEAWLHRALRARRDNPTEARAALERAVAIDAPRHSWKLLADRLLRRI